MEKRTFSLINLSVLAGLVTLCICTLRYIIILWPSTSDNPCAEMFGIQLDEEKRYFIMVALGGALGAFVHIGASFVEFLGNQKVVYSWIPWYFMRPFIGSALAVIFYMLMRGGVISYQPAQQPDNNQAENIQSVNDTVNIVDSTLFTGSATDTVKDSTSLTIVANISGDSNQNIAKDSLITVIVKKTRPAKKREQLPINPFGIMAIACMSGMFSERATKKLAELFNNLFNIKEEKPQKDTLHERESGSTNTNDQTTA
jgi:hypothetical protein